MQFGRASYIVVATTIDIINYVTGIGNGSREVNRVVQTLATLSVLEVFCEDFR